MILTTNYFDHLRSALAQAKHHVLILAYVISYQQYKKFYRSSYIVGRLVDLHKKGISVKILLDSSPSFSHNHRVNFFSFKRLLEAGIKIRMQAGPHPQHSKLIIVDDTVAFSGSHNLVEGSLNSSFELSFEFTDSYYIEALTKHFLTLWDGVNSLPWERRFWPKSKTNQSLQQSPPIILQAT